MNYTKENPIGLDAVINQAQIKLYDLAASWNVALDVYPRCYSKETDRGRSIETFIGGKDYKMLNVAEGNKFFFDAENDINQVGNGFFTTNISLYCVLNLNAVKPDVQHRADAEVWADVMGKLQQVPFFGTADRLITKFNRVFERYDYYQQNDMQPYHCFRIDIPVKSFSIDLTVC